MSTDWVLLPLFDFRSPFRLLIFWFFLPVFVALLSVQAIWCPDQPSEFVGTPKAPNSATPSAAAAGATTDGDGAVSEITAENAAM